jgi:hypothetical protein
MGIIDCHSAQGSSLEFGVNEYRSRRFLEKLLSLLTDRVLEWNAVCFIGFQRYGQKRSSSMQSSERNLLLTLSKCNAQGTVDLGLMFHSSSSDCSLFIKRDFVKSCVSNYSSLHSKSFLCNIADATIRHSLTAPIVKEKIYHTDVYLWRAFGNIPTYQKDPGVLLWFQNKGFNELLPPKFIKQMDERYLQYRQDVELILAAMQRLASTPVSVRYEITVGLEHYDDYWYALSGIERLFREKDLTVSENLPDVFLSIPNAVYSEYCQTTVDCLLAKVSESADALHKSMHSSCRSMLSAGVSSTNVLADICTAEVANLNVWSNMILLFLTGETSQIRHHKVDRLFGISSSLKHHGVLFCPTAVRLQSAVTQHPDIGDLRFYFGSWFKDATQLDQSGGRSWWLNRLILTYDMCFVVPHSSEADCHDSSAVLHAFRRCLELFFNELQLFMSTFVQRDVTRHGFRAHILQSSSLTNGGTRSVREFFECVVMTRPKDVFSGNSLSLAVKRMAEDTIDSYTALAQRLCVYVCESWQAWKRRYQVDALPVWNSHPSEIRDYVLIECDAPVRISLASQDVDYDSE